MAEGRERERRGDEREVYRKGGDEGMMTMVRERGGGTDGKGEEKVGMDMVKEEGK